MIEPPTGTAEAMAGAVDLLISREQALERERELEAEVERLRREIEKRDEMLEILFRDAWTFAGRIAQFQREVHPSTKGGAE